MDRIYEQGVRLWGCERCFHVYWRPDGAPRPEICPCCGSMDEQFPIYPVTPGAQGFPLGGYRAIRKD